MAKGEEGIITNASELIFIGDGQLTINAKNQLLVEKLTIIFSLIQILLLDH